MSESGDVTPDTGETPVPYAARQVTITLNNFTSSALHLRGSSLEHGIFNPGPPQTIYAGTSASWKAESAGFATGTEGYVWYVPADGQTEFQLYWDNPAIGSNSYDSTIKYATSDAWSISNAGTAGNSSAVNFSVYEKVQQWSEATWMKGIEDSRSLARMSIPGTHESGAVFSPDGDILGVVITQDQSITQQLNSGIRFLDIRCRVINDSLMVHHDSVYQNISFGDVLVDCGSFLKVNPSETILLRIKQEYSTASDEEFVNIFESKYRANFSDILFTEPRVPTLGEVRRKVVVISNVFSLPGIYWSSIVVQDEYDPPGYYDKVNAISKNLSAAIADHSSGGNTMYVNFISKQGVPLIQTINQGAAKLNVEFLNLVGEKKAPVATGLGIIAMDFPNRTGGVIPVIINSNFRLVNEQFYSLKQSAVPQVTAEGSTTINFKFTTDNRPPVPGSRLHAVAPPGTRITAMSWQAPEKLTIASDGRTADIVAGSTSSPWQTYRTITLSINGDVELNTTLKGSLQYYTAEGVPGTQTDLNIMTSSFTVIPYQNDIRVQPGGFAQFKLAVEPGYVVAPVGTHVDLIAPPHGKITSISTIYSAEAKIDWYGRDATMTVVLFTAPFWAYVTIAFDEDTPMDIELQAQYSLVSVSGQVMDNRTITFNTRSEGIVQSETGVDYLLLDPGDTATMNFTLVTSSQRATPGARLHASVPEYARILDMSHNEYEILSISADGRSADVIAADGAGPWESERTLTVTLDSNAPEGYAGLGELRFYGASGMEAVNFGGVWILPALSGTSG